MNSDPLAAFISRSLRAEVTDVRSEIVAKGEDGELERVRFRQDGEERTLIVKRVPANDALETQLLPLLARKTDRVPALRSRGIPPPAVKAWPWVLIEDLVDARSACGADPHEIVRAKVEIERAVRGDVPALRALGVPSLGPAELLARATGGHSDGGLLAEAGAAVRHLAELPVVLVHGDLGCANARLVDRGVVLVEWRRAHLGSGLLDIARLASDLRARGQEKKAGDVFALYAELCEISLEPDLVRAAEVIDRAIRVTNS